MSHNIHSIHPLIQIRTNNTNFAVRCSSTPLLVRLACLPRRLISFSASSCTQFGCPSDCQEEDLCGDMANKSAPEELEFKVNRRLSLEFRRKGDKTRRELKTVRNSSAYDNCYLSLSLLLLSSLKIPRIIEILR